MSWLSTQGNGCNGNRFSVSGRRLLFFKAATFYVHYTSRHYRFKIFDIRSQLISRGDQEISFLKDF